MKTNTYPTHRKLLSWLLMALMTEFVLGVVLTTVIAYDPATPTVLQTSFLVAHMLIGAGLFFGSLIHVFTSRDAHILGFRPLIGFVCVLGAFITGGIAAGTGADTAVLLMALFFSGAVSVYGVSYVLLLRG